MDECTRAEIGVGAAIAAGNHAESGNWALFDIAAINKSSKIIVGILILCIFQFMVENIKLIDNKMVISPNRLDRIVIVPEDLDLLF